MFSLRSKLALTATALAAGFVGLSASGTTVATTTFDNDAYVFFGSQSPTSPEISLGNEINAPHFNFGFLEFDDLSLVPGTGDKFLVIDLESFKVPTGPPVGGPPPTVDLPTGNATIKVVGLGVDFDSFFLSADDTARSVWYNTNVGAPDADATATVTQAGLIYFDVTEVVDGWLGSPSTNHGFALVVTDGNAVELGAGLNTFPEGDAGIAATLSTVPEPTSLVLLAAGAVGLLRRRR